MLELFQSESSLKLSDTFAADHCKRIEDAKTGAVSFGTGLAPVEEVLNALMQVDPARRLTVQAVYEKPFSLFIVPQVTCVAAPVAVTVAARHVMMITVSSASASAAGERSGCLIQ